MTIPTAFNTLAQATIASPKTKKGLPSRDAAFAARLQFWIDYFGDKPVTEITYDDVDEGVALLTQKRRTLVRTTAAGVVRVESEQPISGSTVNRYVASLGTAFHNMRRMRLLPRGFVSPLRGVERQPEGDARDIGNVTAADIRRLIACCRVSRNRKLAALVAFSATTGWRQGSVQALTWGALDLKQGFADTARTKNGTPHRCVLQPFVVEELRRIQPTDPHPSALVFGAHSVEKAWRTALQRANLPEDWTLHHLRHVAASILAQNGASVPTIMQALNHKTPAMALRYSHLDTVTLRQATGSAWGAQS